MKRLLSLLALLTAGCANQVYVTWNSDVPGATVVEQVSGVNFGQGPIRVMYDSPVADVNGCYRLQGVIMRWPSGYERASPEVIQGCNGSEFSYSINHAGPKEQKEVDVQYAGRYSEYMRQVAVAQQQQADEANAALWAAALVGVGNAAVNAKYPTTTYTPAPNPYTSVKITPPPQPQKVLVTTPAGCNSDFECGIGRKCVKGPLQGQGQCLTPVNQYGLPQPNVMPDPNSIKINTKMKGACDFDTQCGVGFRCDQALKVCVQ